MKLLRPRLVSGNYKQALSAFGVGMMLTVGYGCGGSNPAPSGKAYRPAAEDAGPQGSQKKLIEKTTAAGFGEKWGAPVALNDGSVAVKSSSEDLYILNSDGTVKKKVPTGNFAIYEDPIHLKNGMLVVATLNDNKVSFIDEDGDIIAIIKTSERNPQVTSIQNGKAVAVTSGNAITFVDQNGNTKSNFTDTSNGRLSVTPLENGRIVVSNSANNEIHLYDQDRGMIGTFSKDEKGRWNEPSVQIHEDGLMAVSSSLEGAIYFLNPDFTKKAAFSLKKDESKYPTPQITGINRLADGTMVFGSIVYRGDNRGRIFWMDPRGNVKASFEDSGQWEAKNETSSWGGFLTMPLVLQDGVTVVAASTDGSVYLLKDGAKISSFATGGSISTMQILPGDQILATSFDGKAYLLDSAGTLIASATVGRSKYKPAVLKDGTIVASWDGRLIFYVLKEVPSK